MEWLTIISWLGNICLILGLYLVGQKKRYAFIFYALGCLGWLIYALSPFQLSLLIIEAIFMIMAVINFIKWKS